MTKVPRNYLFTGDFGLFWPLKGPLFRITNKPGIVVSQRRVHIEFAFFYIGFGFCSAERKK